MTSPETLDRTVLALKSEIDMLRKERDGISDQRIALKNLELRPSDYYFQINILTIDYSMCLARIYLKEIALNKQYWNTNNFNMADAGVGEINTYSNIAMKAEEESSDYNPGITYPQELCDRAVKLLQENNTLSDEMVKLSLSETQNKEEEYKKLKDTALKLLDEAEYVQQTYLGVKENAKQKYIRDYENKKAE